MDIEGIASGELDIASITLTRATLRVPAWQAMRSGARRERSMRFEVAEQRYAPERLTYAMR